MTPAPTLAVLFAALSPQSSDHFADHAGQDALSYELELDVDPAARTLSGTVRYRFRAVEELDEVRLDALPDEAYSVEFQRPDGSPWEAVWKDQQVILRLSDPVPAGAELEFTARLRGRPGEGFYFKDTRDGVPIAFTDHYAVRARGWLPCEDNPADRALFRLSLSFPDTCLALASGRMETAEPADDGRRRLRCETVSDVAPYLFAIVVGTFVELPEAGDPRLVPHLLYEDDVGRARPALVHHAAWLERMEATFGPYAYAKYAIVQCPTRWGGFEAPGNVLVSEALFDRSSSVGILAHELVHMWFGDAVGYAVWREVWLSEGFASYFGPWLHAHSGGPSHREAMRRMRDRWRLSREGVDKPIRWDGFTIPDDALNANTYPKGAWVLHMLRLELGDELFFRALRTYYLRFSGRSVVTRDLVATVDEVAGRSLGWFFDQWLDRPDCPHLHVEATDDGFVVEQRQDAPPFRFLLPLEWREDGEVVRRYFGIHERRTALPVAGKPSFEIDPDVELLYRDAAGG